MLIMFFLPVMLLLLSGGSARVVDNFQSECGQFFAPNTSPTVLPGPQYKQICQTLDDISYYATLYDTYNKIPVYSAYKFTGIVTCKRLNKWYIEPKLDDNNGETNMDSGRQLHLINQASNADYKDSGFHKGHLAPVYQANSQECADATFTLTNAAPQYGSFNTGKWKVAERQMAKTVTSNCKDKNAFIVTGVLPGALKIKNRVNVPSHFWSAYCCKEKINEQLISGAVLGDNSEKNPPTRQKTVIELETLLGEYYGVSSFYLFDNNCRNSNNVPVIIPKIRRGKKCSQVCRRRTRAKSVKFKLSKVKF